MLGDTKAISLLKDNLTTNIFDLKYACVIALNQLGDISSKEILIDDSDLLIREKIKNLPN